MGSGSRLRVLTGLRQARRRAGAAFADNFFLGASHLGRLHPLSNPSRHGIERIPDLRYFDGHGHVDDHVLDVWRPARTSSLGDEPLRPVVVYVHGGGFRVLSKDTHWIMALSFARRGFVVFNVSYRLAPRHRYPSAIEDVCRAFTWVAKNAERFGGDTSRVVLAGESAGGNLAASLALALAYRRPEPFARAAFDTGIAPRAVIPACGVFQVTDLLRLKRAKPKMSVFVADRLAELEDAYLGEGPWDVSLDLADPLLTFERGERPDRPIPPFFLPIGTKDPLLPDTRRLAEALRALGAEAEVKYYPGELHAFHAVVLRASARRCWDDTFEFLERRLSS